MVEQFPHVVKGIYSINGVRVRTARLRAGAFQVGDPAFVLVHGIGVDSRYFYQVAEKLLPYGEVLLVDLPGFGASPRPHTPLSIAGFAAVLHAVIKAAELHNPVILGHSMGAQVVAELAVRDPEMAQRILLVGPPVDLRRHSFPLLLWRFLRSSIHESPKVAAFALNAYARSGIYWFSVTLPAVIGFSLQERLKLTEAKISLIRGQYDYLAARKWVHRLQAGLVERGQAAAPLVEIPRGAHSIVLCFEEQVVASLVELSNLSTQTD
ncbi:alpha/beta hydrolase [Gleimia sp. 6138-11-ORH1]|uniref:alpha/beta fold hydrolase n=1 Tax=Gleimia sp. 6138-11-ORH1 TaxID=2973937 RepID=UPI002167CEB3|nr:alpha/beta hydrolase [Gleimia sp. 6138-11-ORH1]MCS4484642.1 alpha/beta hydrolase [Gleimia sp. 6138-11-ORH1]